MSVVAPIAFVTGGTGFVGSHLVEALLRRGFVEVRCLVRSEPKWLSGRDVRFVRGTLHDRAVIERAVADVDYVFHVAGLTRSQTLDPLIESNVQGTLALMRAVEHVNPNVERVVVTSSLAAVGASKQKIADEATPLRPISMYGQSKAQMEILLREQGWIDRLPIVVVRPPAVYGPRDADILQFFKAVDRGLCPVVGSGTHPEISLVHVHDLVEGMILAAERPAEPGEVFFLGSEEFYSWHAVRDAATAALGRRVVTVHVPRSVVPVVGTASEYLGRFARTYPALNREKTREILEAVKMCSVEKAMSELGFRQRVSLESGVADTIEWYRRHGMLRS